MMEGTRSSETSVLTTDTLRNIQEDGILHISGDLYILRYREIYTFCDTAVCTLLTDRPELIQFAACILLIFTGLTSILTVEIIFSIEPFVNFQRTTQ
jgi:hypothetical protein